MSSMQMQAGSSNSAWIVNAPAIATQNLMSVASELLNHLATIDGLLCALRSGMFGEGESAPSQPPPQSFEGMLIRANGHAAAICGCIATVNDRLGVREGSRG